ncbi:prolyl oligopeptidase family serine peptidase [Candidatus Foliamicus sp.]
MRTTVISLAAVLLAGACGPAEQAGPDYPRSKLSDQRDDYFGVEVTDPYRWMEALDSEETDAWVASQNALSDPYLEGLPLRETLRERLTEVWNYPRRSAPWRHGPWYFELRNDGLQNHSVLYVRAGLDGEARILIDPNTWTEDGTASLAGRSVSPEGRYIAYARSEGGSDWRDWQVREVATGQDLPDRITYTKFTGISWALDEGGFYYSRYPVDDEGRADDQKAVSVYFHTLGTEQSEDRLVLRMPPDEERNAYASVTEDGAFLIVRLQEGYLANAIHYRRLDEPDSDILPLLDQWDALYGYLANDGDTFYFSTNKDAPRRKVIALDVNRPEEWTEIIPQGENVLAGISAVGGRFIASYLQDVQPLVRVHESGGELVETVQLPGVGSVRGFGGRWDDPETFYTFSGFTDPGAIYRYDVGTGESSLHHRTETAIDGSDYLARQVFYSSKDGTRIPMFLVSRRDLEATGDQPTLLYGYGGFNISLLPSYSSERLAWLEMGGLLAIPNLRGGGEYGREWHLAGTRERKQNVFDDFIAAAEWLIEQGYTMPGRLVIQGRSNGGLLVGAVMTQRPDLFGAALPGVGVLDMLRYHTASANARAWADDYGLSENEADFRAQYAYSPVHRVADGVCYPPTLVTTGDHDDRVAPWHSYKFAAALQKAQGCANPVLIRIETRAGHGAGTPTWMRIEDIANQFAFAAEAIGWAGQATAE